MSSQEPHIPEMQDAFSDPNSRFDGTFVFVDVVDSSDMKSRNVEANWVSQQGWFYCCVTEAATAACPGCGIKYLGDGILLFLSSDQATEAIKIAIDVQERINGASQGSDGSMGTVSLKVRIGIATGVVVRFRTSGGIDYVGPAVDRARRLCDAAQASGIFVDRATGSAANMMRVDSTLGRILRRTADEYQGDLEKTVVKGVPDPVAYFEILWSQARFGVNNGTNTAATNQLEAATSQQSATRPATSTAREHVERHSGTVKSWLPDRNFGFVTDGTSGEEFHFSAGQLVYAEDREKLRVGLHVGFVAANPAPNSKHRKAVVVLLAGEYAEGPLVALPPNRSYGWLRVEDGQGNWHPVFVPARFASQHKVGQVLSFRVGVGTRGVFAEDVALAEGDAVA